MRSCVIEQCDNEAKAARGMCWTHYARLRRTGCLKVRNHTPLSTILKEMGISYRQFDYWARNGLLPDVAPTPGTGFPREISPKTLLVIEILGELSDLGINVRGEFVRQVLDAIDNGDEARTVGRLTINLKYTSNP